MVYFEAMKQAVCPNDTIETSWISRHSKMPHICSAMNLIDGEEFYRKYLLHVKFEGNYDISKIMFTICDDC